MASIIQRKGFLPSNQKEYAALLFLKLLERQLFLIPEQIIQFTRIA